MYLVPDISASLYTILYFFNWFMFIIIIFSRENFIQLIFYYDSLQC